MKAKIKITANLAGRLHIYPDDETEAFALAQWHAQYVNGGSSELQIHNFSLEDEQHASQR